MLIKLISLKLDNSFFMQKTQRVHILTSWWCINDCVFCMDDKTLRRFITLTAVEEQLRQGLLYSNEVCFTSGEPTIHPQIIEFIQLSKDMWYKCIQIMSNGRKYKDMKFVTDLIGAGITDFMISVHGSTALIHDAIVRRQWAFVDLLAGMINISKMKNKYPYIQLSTSTTVFRYNYLYMDKIVFFLEKFPIDTIVLNAIIPQQEALKNQQDVLIQYTEMLPILRRIIPIHRVYKNISINGFPYCLGEDMKNMLWYREPVMYSQGDEIHLQHVDSDNVSHNLDIDTVHITGKEKRDLCKKCKHYNICEWVWSSYVWIYWWDEFLPQ